MVRTLNILVPKYFQGPLRRFIRPKFLLIGLLFYSLFFSQYLKTYASANSKSVRSWVDVEVLSFDGETISIKLVMKVVGNHANQAVRIKGEFFSGESVSVEVARFISDVEYSADLNITTFRYSYAYDFTTYQAVPKLRGLLVFPRDEHSLVLYILTSFNTTIDEHDRAPLLPSANYEGVYRVRQQPMEDNQYKFKLTLEIKHSSTFILSASILVWGTFFSLAALTALLFVFLFSHWKDRRHFVDVLVPIASAVVVFIPLFELALQSLKSPLPIVLSDLCFFALVPCNVLILFLALGKTW